MSVNGGLDVGGEIGVRNRRVTETLFVRLRDGDALAQLAARAFRSPDDSHGPAVLLYDYLQSLIADSGQDDVEIAGEFDFGQPEDHVISIIPAMGIARSGCEQRSMQSMRKRAEHGRYYAPWPLNARSAAWRATSSRGVLDGKNVTCS